MILSLYEKDFLGREDEAPGTVSRDLKYEASMRKKRDANELTPLQSYMVDNNYVERKTLSMWTSSNWKPVFRGTAVVKIIWEAKMAVPVDEKTLRVVEGTATLDFQPLGNLSFEEQRFALAFIEKWSSIGEKVESSDSRDSQEKWKFAIEQQNPALIPNPLLEPTKTDQLSLRLLLLNDPSYWEMVDKKQTLNNQEKIAFEANTLKVLDLYEKLVKVASDFQYTAEKETVKMRTTIGNDETPIVQIN
jgi:hypothetical protein